MNLRILTVTTLAALLTCAPSEYVYAPVRTTAAELQDVSAAASQPIPPESPRGELRVVMRGFRSLEAVDGIEDSTLRAICLDFTLQNRSDETWSLAGREQRVQLAGDPRFVAATTVKVESPPMLEVPPGTTRSIELFFPLATRTETPKDLPAFDVIWTVRLGSRLVTRRVMFGRFLDESWLAPPLPKESGEMTP